MKILFGLLLCVAPMIADGQAFLRTSAGAAYTALFNEADRDGVHGIDNRLTFRPAAGLELGSRFLEGSDLHSIAIGVHYVSIAQKYQLSDLFGRYDEFEGVRSAQYLRIPLTLTFALSHRSKVKPLFVVGAYYARLVGHRDAASQTVNGVTFLDYEANSGEYTSLVQNHLLTGSYEGSYYKRFDAGPFAGFSVEFDLGSGLMLDAGIRASYGLTRIENRTYLWHTLENGNQTYSVPINPYDSYPYIGYGNFIPPHRGVGGEEPRPQSHTVTAGLEVGLKYLLRAKSKSGSAE